MSISSCDRDFSNIWVGWVPGVQSSLHMHNQYFSMLSTEVPTQFFTCSRALIVNCYVYGTLLRYVMHLNTGVCICCPGAKSGDTPAGLANGSGYIGDRRGAKRARGNCACAQFSAYASCSNGSVSCTGYKLTASLRHRRRPVMQSPLVSCLHLQKARTWLWCRWACERLRSDSILSARATLDVAIFVTRRWFGFFCLGLRLNLSHV